jgi:putative nucleotidyltransferase with HDIG domain
MGRVGNRGIKLAKPGGTIARRPLSGYGHTVTTRSQPASHAYSLGLLLTAACAAVVLGAGGGLTAEPPLWGVVGVAVLTALPWAVQSGERVAVTLIHLPVLAAVFLCSPVVAPLLAGALAAIDNRTFGRAVAISSAGGYAIAAAAAVGAFRLASAAGLATDPSDHDWFAAAFLAAAVFFLVNHALVSGMIALTDGEPPRVVWRRFLRPMVGADLIGSAILIGFLSLAAGVQGTALKMVAGGVAVIAVALLFCLIDRSRRMEEAMRERERAVVEREQAVLAREDAAMGTADALEMAETAARGERRASERAARAVTRLNDVASGTIPVLVAMVDLRDRYTAQHSAGVGRLCCLLAEELGWAPEDVALAHMTGLVHDIGKVGLPDGVLRKPARPTPEEWDLIRRHPDWGADALAEMHLMPAAVDGVRAHHERWDGSGYPEGLGGYDIPSLGRLVALCDSYDAMTGRRPFRGRKPPGQARAELGDEAGVLYDPEMTAALLRVLEGLDDVEEIAAPRDFAGEWRRACAGIDMERLYMRLSTDLEDAIRS